MTIKTPILSTIEPDPSSSAQEVRAALEAMVSDFEDRCDCTIPYSPPEAYPVYCRARKALASAPPVRSNAEGER